MPKVPRDLSGNELASRLEKFGYSVTRQTGSHMRLTSSFKGATHNLTIPVHDPIRIGTLNHILDDLSSYLQIEKQKLIAELFQQ